MRPGKRFRHGHWARLQPRLEWGEHLWEVIDAGYTSECWMWLRAIGSSGYGQFSRSTPAHRLAYEKAIGSIPEGLDLDHLCRNRACVNPEHLEPVTRAENIRRGRGTRLDWSDVVEIRSSTEGLSALAQRFGVSQNHIWMIRKDRKWKHA